MITAAVAAVIAATSLGAATPEARQVYGMAWTAPSIDVRPCALSIIMPAGEAEHCASWNQRETSGPAFHARLGLVVVGGSDHHLRALDAKTGKSVWTKAVPGSVVSQPAIVGDVVYAGTDDARVVGIDVNNGEQLWVTPVDAEVTEPVVVHDDAIYVVTGNDSTYALSRTTGEPLWVNKAALPRGITLRGQARPLVVDVAGADGGKRVFVGHANGRLVGLDRDSGAVMVEVDLSHDDAFGDIDADPVFHAASNVVVAASQTRGISALHPTTGLELWKNPEAGITRLATGGAPMVVAAGAGKVLGLDATTGKTIWRFTFAQGAPTRIAVKGGRVHVGSDRGSLYVLDLSSGRPLQYAGSGTGVAADLALWQDMVFFTATSGRVMAMSSAWHGLVFAMPPSSPLLSGAPERQPLP